MKTLKNLFTDRTWLGSLFRVSLLITLFTVPFWYNYQIVHIDGISMTPTYDDGQWTIMRRGRSLGNNWRPERFDVIVVWSNKLNTKLIKRVIGLPGEKLEIIEGRIYIDGRQLYDPYGKGYMVYRNFIDIETDKSWLKEYQNICPAIINSDHVWVIGDYREDSYFGHFPIKNICGKIVLD